MDISAYIKFLKYEFMSTISDYLKPEHIIDVYLKLF